MLGSKEWQDLATVHITSFFASAAPGIENPKGHSPDPILPDSALAVKLGRIGWEHGTQLDRHINQVMRAARTVGHVANGTQVFEKSCRTWRRS
jgi:hypothetical protein